MPPAACPSIENCGKGDETVDMGLLSGGGWSAGEDWGALWLRTPHLVPSMLQHHTQTLSMLQHHTQTLSMLQHHTQTLSSPHLLPSVLQACVSCTCMLIERFKCTQGVATSPACLHPSPVHTSRRVVQNCCHPTGPPSYTHTMMHTHNDAHTQCAGRRAIQSRHSLRATAPTACSMQHALK